MDELIQLLEQIQELAGAGVDALKGAKGDAEGGKPEGGPPREGGDKPPAEGGEPPREGGAPPPEGPPRERE